MAIIDKSEHPRWYDGYIELVPDGDVIKLLEENKKITLYLFKTIDNQKGLFRYEKGKWSIKEILGHIIDTERIFSYRILRFAKGDKTDIPQYDHNMYVENGDFDNTELEYLIEEYRLLRTANILFFKNITPEKQLYVGTSEGKSFTVRALMSILIGHERHHINVLKEKYLT